MSYYEDGEDDEVYEPERRPREPDAWDEEEEYDDEEEDEDDLTKIKVTNGFNISTAVEELMAKFCIGVKNEDPDVIQDVIKSLNEEKLAENFYRRKL